MIDQAIRFRRPAFKPTKTLLTALVLLCMTLAACGSSSDSVPGGAESESPAQGSQLIGVSLSTSQLSASDITATTQSTHSLIDLNSNWPTWAGADSGITYDANTNSLRVPGDGSDIIIGVRRFEQPLVAGQTYTLSVQADNPQSAAVLFLFGQSGELVWFTPDVRQRVAFDDQPVTFTAPDGVAGFFLQVQNAWQATGDTVITPDLTGGGDTGSANEGNLIDLSGEWLTWEGESKGVSFVTDDYAYPVWAENSQFAIDITGGRIRVQSQFTDNALGVKRMNRPLTAGTEYAFSMRFAIGHSTSTGLLNNGNSRALLFLFGENGQVIPIQTEQGPVPFIDNYLPSGVRRFVAPAGVTTFAIQVQSIFTTESFVVPYLQTVANHPPRVGCEILPENGFESERNEWSGPGIQTIVNDALNGENALSLRDGAISFTKSAERMYSTVSADGRQVLDIFVDIWKKTASENAYVGVDFLDAQGNEIEEKFTRLRPSPNYSQGRFLARYTGFPVRAAQVRVWLYSDSDPLILDDVNVGKSCRPARGI